MEEWEICHKSWCKIWLFSNFYLDIPYSSFLSWNLLPKCIWLNCFFFLTLFLPEKLLWIMDISSENPYKVFKTLIITYFSYKWVTYIMFFFFFRSTFHKKCCCMILPISPVQAAESSVKILRDLSTCVISCINIRSLSLT